MKTWPVYRPVRLAVAAELCFAVLAGCQTAKPEPKPTPSIPKGYFDNVIPNSEIANMAYKRADYKTAYEHYSLMAEDGSPVAQADWAGWLIWGAGRRTI